jgi:anti-sigma factor RsiW
MSTQHLSDEAVAAFADGVLGGTARTRAARHTSECPECAHAVAVQREAVWALRAAPAPALPTGLLDRLRSVPADTPIEPPPSAIAPDGSAVFPAFGTSFGSMAAFVPETRQPARARRARPLLMGAAVVAAAGAVVAGAAGAAAGQHRTPQPGSPATGSLVRYDAPAIAPADAGMSVAPHGTR